MQKECSESIRERQLGDIHFVNGYRIVANIITIVVWLCLAIYGNYVRHARIYVLGKERYYNNTLLHRYGNNC